ncbi:hypothetical protein [Streptomyces sp. NPDC057413]|uniref:hypothetical protein n=1 Tax=Streptomyces sp. NPDC057413 TaxID=3346124 RepID=UPI00369CBF2F
MKDFQKRLAVFLAMSDEELRRPLWEIEPADRKAFLSARNRRFFAGASPDEIPEHDQRVTDWAEAY